MEWEEERNFSSLLILRNILKELGNNAITTQQIPLLSPFILSRPIPLCYESSKWQDDDRYDSQHSGENYAVSVL